MLLTSWVESMRLAFEKSRKATLNPRRRLQLRSVPSSARQKVQHKVAIEQLEDRTLLTSLIINQLTPGLGVNIDNSVLDPDADGESDFDSIIFEDLTITATSGAGVSIDLDNLTFNEPFEILFDNVSISSSAGVGIDIELSNLLVDTIAVDSSTITGGVGNAFNLDLTDVVLNEFNVIDSTLTGQSGAGLTATVNSTLSTSIIEETSLRRSTIDGVSIDVQGGSILRHTTMADNTIAGTSGSDGVNFNLVDSIAEELRITNNNSIQGIAISVDDTVDGDAALLTELFIHSNNITGNTAGDGVRFDLNNVDQFISLTDNFITANSGHGVIFNQTDGDLSGSISGNTIANNTGHGVFFSPSTTNPPPTGNGAPGVPAFAGTPGPTDIIDFAAPRNEVQLITFEGVPTSGDFTISYIGGDGVEQMTAPIVFTATAAQVKMAMVDAFDEISVNDILVNGNFQDGYEIEFVNALAGRNINPLTVNTDNLMIVDPTVPAAPVQDTLLNVSEIQELVISGVAPTFGTFGLFFLGQTATFSFSVADPTPANAATIQTELNDLALNAGFPDDPIIVTETATGFIIAVDDNSSLAFMDIEQIIPDVAGLGLSIIITEQFPGGNGFDERQDLQIISAMPVGETFTLSFQGQTTGPITIDASDATTRTNIETALELLTNIDDVIVFGSIAGGYSIIFNGALVDDTNLPLLQATVTSGIIMDVTTTVPGFGVNEIQRIDFPDEPGGGTFTLNVSTVPGETVELDYNATAAEVQAQLELLSSIGVGNVSVTGSIATGGFLVEFIGTLSLRPTNFLLEIDPANLRAAVPTVTTVAEGTSNNEVQEIIVDGTPVGNFDLLFNGGDSALMIPATATAEDLRIALEGLAEIGTGNVIVRGDAATGFEIEYIGALANVNMPQIEVDTTNLMGATMTVKTTSVGGQARGISGNTITGNTGAGVQVELEMFTSFYGDLTGNTISSNNATGVNLEAADPTTLHSVDFSLDVDGNTFDDNSGAGVAVSLQDTATGDVRVANNTITGTNNDNNTTTPYAGDAIYIDLFGTDVSFEAFSQLRDLTVDGNFIGTDAANTGGLGNVGHGVAVHIEESTIIDRTQISNNVVANNIGDGVNFHREDDARVGRADIDPIVGEERAVRIYSNTITGNSDGIDILAQNGSLTTTDFEIKDNTLSSNIRDGLSLHAEADALIFADVINNQITSNLFNGIESTTRSTSYDGTDQRDVAGTWIQNNISNNLQHGIEISGKIGNHEMLFIGLNGVDPVTGLDRGNMIESNGRDGIQIAAFLDPIDGNVEIANNSILSNATGGIELLGKGLTASIDDNLIAFNNGKGVDINSSGITAFIRRNVITENTFDGLEVLAANTITHIEDAQAIGPTHFNRTTSVTAIGNFIDNNGGRGVDLQTQNQANSDFIFGDGTEAGANYIVSNALEGFYVVTTASRAQDQDASSTAALDATGNVLDTHADMVLQVATNFIQDNGVNSPFSASGLILRIGTMGGSRSTTDQTPGNLGSVGAEGSSDFGNGRSNVSITNTEFEGNFGEDVYIEPFVSTVDPAITGGNWDIAATPSYNPTGYQRDPLARLNLVFEGNSGNGLNLTNTAIFYDTNEPTFKSRLNNGTPAPNPDGPFTSGTRRRNATRVASRSNQFAAPIGAPNIAPTVVGSVLNATIDPVSGRIIVTSTDVSSLIDGDTVEITGVFSTDIIGPNPANGVFVITDIDYVFNTFSLRSTEGADIGTYFFGGSWSHNDGSFLYDGTGVSTFRIAQGFENNNFTNSSAVAEFNTGVTLGGLTGELPFEWGSWTPDADTFLVPVTQTFLTADISVASPDPTDDPMIDPFIISFTENVVGVDLADFELLLNNAPVAFGGTASIDQIDARTYRLNFGNTVIDDGEYELHLLNNGSIFDADYDSNTLLFGDVERFTVDTVGPMASFEQIAALTNSAVGDVVLNFDEDVVGVDLADFTLDFSGDSLGPVNLAGTAATLTQVTGSQFVLNLSQLTSLSGTYTLTLLDTGSSITDLAGNDIVDNDPDLKLEWETDTLAPTGTFSVPGTDSKTDAELVTFTLTEKLEAGTLDITDFTLIDANGVRHELNDSIATLTTPPPASPGSVDQIFTIDLENLDDINGNYEIIFNVEETSAVDPAGNKVANSVSLKWTQGTDFIAPTAGMQFDGTDEVTITFSEAVFQFDSSELLLERINGSTTTTITLSAGDLTGAGTLYTLNLSGVTGFGPDGVYVLTLLTTGNIEDGAGNAFVSGATEVWQFGDPAVTATISGPDPVILNDAGIVTINFGGQPVTGVTIDDFQLTLNGQNIPLDLLSVSETTPSSYRIDLSNVTNADGDYVLTLVAAGSEIETIATGDPLVDNATLMWTKISTITVTETGDGTDSTAGDGVVGDGTDPASKTLRAAIQEANALAGSNVIDLGAGEFLLDIAGIDEDFAASGDLDIRDNLTIRGQGVGVTIIDGGALDRIFQIFAGVTLNLENLTIRNGALTGSADGAGIRNSGTTTLTNVRVSENQAEDSGGGINNSGLMVIVESTIDLNEAGGSGGGIRNTGTLEITRSTISGNTTARDGGGLYNAGFGNVTASNSTFSGNISERSGGAIRNAANLTATNNTMTGNSALTTGGAINNSSSAILQNNLVIGNTTGVGGELQGAFNSLGGNLTGELLGTATGFGLFDIVDQLDSTLILDSNLADNGGPTLTHALVPGSIAIDAGINANVDALEQRGSTRILGTNVDIGAVEAGAFFVNSFLDTVDDSPGDGVAADENGLVTLRAAIMEANALAGDSVIILGPGTYALTIAGLADDTAESGDLDITDITGSLTIIGSGDGQTIIDASLLDERVFDVLSGANLTLEGLTVTGGNAVGESGGGIRNVGTVALVNTLIDANTAGVNGGGILNGELGEQGILTLTNSVVSNNTGVDGGGIFNNDQSQITIVDSEVSGNTASGDGGGLYNDLQAIIDITRSSISGNTATLDGGGIYNNDLASLTLTDSNVRNNTSDQGGGIFNEEAATLNVTGTTVSGNTAMLNGGGIYNDEGVVTLSNVSILVNSADVDGGGFYNASAGQVTISNGFFDDNSAGRDGGGIANFGVSLALNNTTVKDSVAGRNGGGLYNDQEEGLVTITGTTLINNTAVSGGGVYNQELGNIEFDFSDIINNTASANGGGIFNTHDAIANVRRTTVDGNSAVDGGGIYNQENALLNLIDSTVSNNTATGNGGGVYNNSIILSEVTNATISGNSAADGGGIYNDEEGFLDLINVTIANNTATTGNGGGVLNNFGFVRVANTIIAANTATSAIDTRSDIDGEFLSRGNNLIGVNQFGSGFGAVGDQVGSTGSAVIPGLGTLQDNGGATFTHELLGGSLARDAGNNFFAPTNDQRGFARLFDGDGNGSLVVDIGAFESGYIVTAFGDSVDASPGDGVSVDANGNTTLRAAIMEANARIGSDTILLGIGTYTLSLFGFGEDNAALGDLDITDDLTIIGAGAGKTFIDADFLDRIFHIFTGVNVSITGVTLVNGDVSRVEDGGAILNYGNLTLEDVEIRNSLANRGGALFNNSVVTINNSYFWNNTAIADGGAIFNSNGGTVTLTSSKINDNDAENGGGIYNTTSGTLEIIDTTLDGNSATVAGGAIYNSSEAAVGNGEGGDDSGIPGTPDPTPVSQFTIDVVFIDSTLTPSQQAIFQIAADRWSEIIIGDVPDVTIPGIGLVDDLRIEASAPFIDGVSGILGQAGPTLVRTGSFIPVTGFMEFDSADVAALEASGQLLDVILHEMAHVIGFGTIWNALGLVTGLDTPDPRYTGTEAITQYNTLLGRNVADIPVANVGEQGDGSFGVHWRESDLGNELMTPTIDFGVMPLSVITVGSLVDLGYVVDFTAADSFSALASLVQPLNLIPVGEMLPADPFTVIDESAFANVEAGAGTVTIASSTISNNTAGTRGGGLLNEDPIEISNVTFSANSAGKEGGAIHNSGELTINNTTIYQNETEGSGGGIYSVADTGSVDIKNTIVAGNDALVSGADVEGTFNSLGHNLIGTNGTVTDFIDGFNNDIVGSDSLRIDPVLGDLANNGGPTMTHALLPESDAIDNGDNTDGVATDQRGATRPTDTTSDIGAFELTIPVIVIQDVAQIEGNTGETAVFEFIVTLSNPSVDQVTVQYETSNGTADAGTDYNFATGTLVFAAGETTQIIRVSVLGDDVSEAYETFTVNLFNAVGASLGTNGTLDATGTIQNDDVGFDIEVDMLSNPIVPNVSHPEGPEGLQTNFDFEIKLLNPVEGVVTVLANTVMGTADPTDYDEIVDQQITFDPGEMMKIVTVSVNGDSEIEDHEEFTLVLSAAEVDGVSVGIDGLFTLTGEIRNDDEPTLSISDVTFLEPETGTVQFVFTVTLSSALQGDLTFLVDTMDISAVAGANEDYIALSGFSVTIAGGTTSKTVSVTVNSESPNEVEDLETFEVVIDESTPFIYGNLSDPTVEVVKEIGIGTIVDFSSGIIVTTTDDFTDDGDPATVSLREAIDMANDPLLGVDTIFLDANLGEYKITLDGPNENGNATGDFDITESLNIVSLDSNTPVINAQGFDRIFHVHNDANLTLTNLKLTNGDADDGGAIYSEDGDLTLDRVIFESNEASFLGGAIFNFDGTLDISGTTFLSNDAGFQGGAIYQRENTATVKTSTFTGNTSGGRGGAIYVAAGVTEFNIQRSLFNSNDAGTRGGAIYNEGVLNSINTTFSGNHSGSRGGAIFNIGTLNLIHNTLTLNTADQTGGGGGISNGSDLNLSATVFLANTIVAGNLSGAANDADDLQGDYDSASHNNLIGVLLDPDNNGLIKGGAEQNIIEPINHPINLGSLSNNGGPTLTHALLPGSVAINTGSGVDSAGEDQRGLNRPNASAPDIGAFESDSTETPTAPFLIGTGGDTTEAEEQTNIQISVVTEKTSVSSTGHTLALPGNEDWIHEWESFWVEVWVDTASGFSISEVLTDIAYNSAYFTATAVEFGAAFTFSRTYSIDDDAGVVRNLGASSILPNVGETGHVLLARVRFESLEEDQVSVDPTDFSFGPLELGLDVLNTQIDVSGVGEVVANVGALPQTDLYPVVYDINDNDAIDFDDLTFFVSFYSQDVYSSSSPFVTAMDFDKSGSVDFNDLTLLAANYGRAKGSNAQVDFPANFGQKWIGSSLETVSGSENIDEVVEAAIGTWETALNLTEPLDIQVIVQDFGSAQLGSGQTTEYSAEGIPVGGRVVIDDDANGLGWHVDSTELPPGGGYDLYTVLLHEIAHVLGFNLFYAGYADNVVSDNNGGLEFVGSDFTVTLDSTGHHIEDPAFLDDLMNPTLDPGVRKTPSAISVQMLLESYASAQAGNGSNGGSIPLLATKTLPTTDIVPEVVQSAEAAQVFIEQSTVEIAIPIVVKKSEEDTTQDSVSQMTFDVIQPSLLLPSISVENDEFDESVFEDLYSSTEFEDGLLESETDDKQLVFAHSANELEFDITSDFNAGQDDLDEAFADWEGPLL